MMAVRHLSWLMLRMNLLGQVKQSKLTSTKVSQELMQRA
jgi:hypothetical protein